LCESYSHGFSTYCPTGSQKALCNNRLDQYVLYQWQQEQGVNPSNRPSAYSAYECSRDAYANTDYYCRLGCDYNRCVDGTDDDDRCDQLSAPGPCFGSVFTCKAGVLDQVSDAHSTLVTMIDCLGTKIPPETRFISSISDNSNDRCLGDWNRQCLSSEDSCSGDCCGHSECSLHYGGRANMDDGTITGPSVNCGIGTINCRKKSWAVDIGREAVQYYSSRGYDRDQIQGIYRSFAQECVNENAVLRLGGGALQVYNEGDHIHVGLSGVAGYVNYRCMP